MTEQTKRTRVKRPYYVEELRPVKCVTDESGHAVPEDIDVWISAAGPFDDTQRARRAIREQVAGERAKPGVYRIVCICDEFKIAVQEVKKVIIG